MRLRKIFLDCPESEERLAASRRDVFPKRAPARRALGAAVLALCCAAGTVHAPAAEPDALEARVAEAMDHWRVPGLAAAGVRAGRVAWRRAFGVADVETQRPITTRTLFAVGSITKSFTATVLAMLADDGRLDLDRPVAAYLSEFRLMDPQASRGATARDLLTHRTGMPRHDVLWYSEAFGRREMVRRLRYLEPTTGFRETFQYSNLMYMVAGYLAGRITGAGWERTVRRRILKPLDMADTRLGFIAFLSAPDIASGYFGTPGGRVAIPARDTDAIGPAASVYSTADDMARYLRFHLAGGVFEGKRLLSAPRAAELRTPQIDTARDRGFEEFGDVAYGMGFYVSTYRGHTYAYHLGFIDGYGALVGLLPEDGVGVVVLTNLSGQNPVPKMVARMVMDRLLGLEPIPWVERYREAEEARKRRIAARRARARRAAERPVEPGGPPPVPRPRPRALAAYAGLYVHPGYGAIRIRAEANGLAGRFHRWVFPLVRQEGDVWRLPDTVWPLRAGLRFIFVAGPDGRIVRLETPLSDGPTYPYKVGPVAFERVERMGSEPISESGN